MSIHDNSHLLGGTLSTWVFCKAPTLFIMLKDKPTAAGGANVTTTTNTQHSLLTYYPPLIDISSHFLL